MDTSARQIHNFKEGDLFDRHYRLLELVGSGGFADVWRANDELVDTVVALKIYTRLDREGISELAKEYKGMKGVKHPNLLTGNHFDANGNIPYLEMDYCDGGSLFNKMGKMTTDELRHVLRDIAGGLAYLHSKGIVHQDIKPENILYDTVSNSYLLSDFGISGKSRTRLSRSVNMAQMTLSMTEAYAPPEKFSGNLADIEPDTKGDIFSLGMTLFELAAGKLPFIPPMATGREMLYSHGRLQLDYSSIGDPLLRRIVEGCTRYGKDERLTADEVLAILDDKKADAQPAPSPAPKQAAERPKTVKIKLDTDGKKKPELPKEPKSSPKQKKTSSRKWVYWVVALVGALLAMLLIMKFGGGFLSDTSGAGEVQSHDTPNGRWEGKAVDGKPDGTGTLTYNEGDEDGRLRYEGAMRQGLREDTAALLVYVNGNTYEGSFVEDQLDKGKMTLKNDGLYYEGTFKDNKPWSGKWYWDDGTVYSNVVNGVEK